SLGDYRVMASLDKKAFDPPAPRPPDVEDDDADAMPWRNVVTGNFLVAAYRRPDFRVDATLAGDSPLAGGKLKAVLTARYLFGAAMGARPVSWTYARSPQMAAPPAVLKAFPADRFQFVGCCDEGTRIESAQLAARTTTLTSAGDLTLDLDTQTSDGVPY